MQRKPAHDSRSAFSLLELLVVIAIIALLAALSTAAIQKYRALGEDLKTKNEIAELVKAIGKFCNEEKLGAVGFLPSRITINGGDPASQAYLAKMFPMTGGKIPGIAGGQLEGHQCLVFFLAGPHVATKRTWNTNEVGWSTDPQNPAKAGGERLTFYEFQTNRLLQRGNFMCYQDPWGTPYAYFSSTANVGGQWVYRNWRGAMNDCASLGVFPYVNANVSDYSFQIISAGRNGVFGKAGGTWTPSRPYPGGDAGFDDVTNFHGSLLGGR